MKTDWAPLYVEAIVHEPNNERTPFSMDDGTDDYIKNKHINSGTNPDWMCHPKNTLLGVKLTEESTILSSPA